MPATSTTSDTPHGVVRPRGPAVVVSGSVVAGFVGPGVVGAGFEAGAAVVIVVAVDERSATAVPERAPFA
jgi:hypothetical protein